MPPLAMQAVPSEGPAIPAGRAQSRIAPSHFESCFYSGSSNLQLEFFFSAQNHCLGRIQQWQLHWRQGAHPGHGHAPPGAHGTRHPQGGGRAPARRHGAISPAKITKIRTRIRILRIGSERKLRRASVRAGQKRPGGATGAGEYQQAGHRNMGQKILPGHVLPPHPPPNSLHGTRANEGE